MKSSLAKQIIVSEIFEMNTAFIQFGEGRIDFKTDNLMDFFRIEGIIIEGEDDFNFFMTTLYFYPKSKKYLIPYKHKQDNVVQWAIMNIDGEDVSLKKMD